MTVEAEAVPDDPPEPERVRRSYYDLHPTYRLTFRWLYIGALTGLAFHSTLANLAMVARQGAIASYVWMVPAAAILAAIGVARRGRTELPIHDRQTDVIIGTMGLVFALLLHAVLLQRYAMYFYLLRLDLVAMWMFVSSCAVVLFGLRPVMRFWRVWVLLLAVFPLWFYITVILLGGTKFAAGTTTLIIAASATGIATGRTYRRGILGGLATWVVGLVVLGVMLLVVPDWPFLAFVEIPALSAIAVSGVLFFLYARRGAPKRVLDRKVEPLASRQVWAGVPLVLLVAVALALVKLPGPVSSPAVRFDDISFSVVPSEPPGWHTEDERTYTWVQRLHGPNATLNRQVMVANVGNPAWDKLSRPRTVVVDTLTTYRPFSLNVYPSKVLYSVERSRLSKPRTIDLGYGITGELVSVVDDDVLVTWNMLQWSWRNADTAQRVLLIAVDNHDDGAPFPQPSGGLVSTLNTLFTVLFRGNSAVADQDPSFKDAGMLTEIARAMVTSRMDAVT